MQRGGRSDLVLVINRAPCKAVCTVRLTNWLSANRTRYPNVRFILAPTGTYAPTITREQMIVQILNYLDATGQQLQGGVSFQDFIATFTTEEIHASFERQFGRLIHTSGAREEEATDESDLRWLASVGWELSQFQARPSPTAAELRFADMVGRVRENLAQTFDHRNVLHKCITLALGVARMTLNVVLPFNLKSRPRLLHR